MTDPSVIAIIPARGGSKGLPRKNIRMLAGKPLIAHSIATALESRMINRTVVTTDDEEIAEVAKQYGAEVPFTRPDELAKDETTDLPVFKHAVAELQSAGAKVDVLVHLRPTCPVRRTSTVDQAIELFLQSRFRGSTSLRSVSVPRDNPFKMWRIENGRLRPLIELPDIREPYNTPRQHLPPVYWQNGYIDVTTAQTLNAYDSMTGPQICAFVVKERIFDIDYEDSLQEANEFLASGQDSAAVFERHFPG